jgi:hypothetical protein
MQRIDGASIPQSHHICISRLYLQMSFCRDLAEVASAESPSLSTAFRYRDFPGHFQQSFCTQLGLMHSELSWRCRLHPNVRKVYAAMYQSDELVTGVDCVFYTPVISACPRCRAASLRCTQDSNKAEICNPFWAHADQNKRAVDSGSWDVYQGIVYVLPSQPSDAFPDSSTTVLLPKSHTELYDELMAATSAHSRSHYCEIKHLMDGSARARLGQVFRKGCRRVPVPEGSLLLWNSKTLHQAIPARAQHSCKPQCCSS